MRKFKYFLTGILIALILNLFTTCQENKKNPVESEPPDNNDPVVQEIDEDSKVIIEAFGTGNVNNVKNVLSENARKIYGAELEKVKDKFNSFGKALENKKLIAYSEMYAEYEIEIDGIKYMVAFAKATEASEWKLVKM